MLIGRQQPAERSAMCPASCPHCDYWTAFTISSVRGTGHEITITVQVMDLRRCRRPVALMVYVFG